MDSLFPVLQGFCIPYNMPVYPGLLRFARDLPETEEASSKPRWIGVLE